ncbi:MAG: helix-turn-helix domain-containing protein [Caldilineaceae bacterium]|nr:helix-turn-helix domain-containing protein [Caldilineaceae bacterium]
MKAFGKLVAGLRKEQFDSQRGERWTQTTLAQATGLSQRVIATIEQGTRAKLETDVLVRLADAFKLNFLTRKEFFSLALEPDPLTTANSSLQSKIQTLLHMMASLPVPALLHDDFYDILAVNSLSIAFNISLAESVGITEPLPTVTEYNLLKMLFAPNSPHRKRLSPMWSDMSSTCVQLFYRYTLRHRSSKYFQTLCNQLLVYREFRQVWEAVHDGDVVEANNYQAFQTKHPYYGVTLWYHGVIISETPVGNLHLSLVLPANHAAFDAIAASRTTVSPAIYPLQPWPTAEKFPDLR